MTLTHRTLVAIACIVCIEATSGCRSRGAPPATPVAAQPDQPASPPEDLASPPAPRAPDPPVAASIPPITQPAPAVDQCALIAGPGEAIATVALSDRVDPSNAPRPSNDSERLLFRQVYETLIRSDCGGRAVPGLAASWRLDGDGRTWLVTLRDNARFSDGSPVTAMDVRASWSDTGGPGELRRSAARLIESVVTIGEQVLAVRLRSQRTDAPLPLAHSDLAVAKAVADSPWPAGTRSVRITPDQGSAPSKGPSFVVSGENLPPIRFVVATGDPRDLLDRGAELLLTRDPATLRYAASLPQFQTVPMAWQRTYVLLSPGRSRAAPALTESSRHALASDAVRGEARGALGPFWWQMLADCEIGRAAPPGQPSPTPRIVYEAADMAARDLAERLVGLARAPGPSSTVFLDALLPDRPRRTYERAAGLTGDALAVARRRGTDVGHIIAVVSSPVDPCRDLQALMDDTPWLDPETIVPLVDTRLHAIVRRGRSGVSAESDGGLMIAGVNARQ